jgi:phytoene dehydrogenase-like protein
MSENQFDVIIIGAGVSGLTAAALLSKAGLSVCVLERHRLIGGYLQGFERKGFIFDTAIHWLNQCGKGGTVTNVFKYLGDDFPKPVGMKNIHRHISSDYEFTLSNNPDELKEKLIHDFPHEKQGIEKFFEAAKVVAQVSKKFPKFFVSNETKSGFRRPFFMLKQLGIIYPLIKYALYGGEKGVEKGLRKFFKDEKLLGVFRSEPDLLSCLFPIAWAYNDDFQNPPIGGSQVIPEWLQTKLNSENSEVVLSAEVFKIDVQDGAFKSVTYRKRLKEYTVSAKHLIAACDVDVLYKKLLPESVVSKSIVQKLDKAELYSSSVTISVALNCTAESLGFGEEMIQVFNDDTPRMEHNSGDPHKSFLSILAPSVRDRTLAPENHGTLNIFVPAWMDYGNNWGTALNAKGEYDRNEEYKRIKEEFAQIIFDRMEDRVCPNLREHILFYEVATPVTYFRYTHNKDGSMMGTRPGKTNMQLKVAHYLTPVKNIIIGGHWAELGGGVPIAVKAAYNASLIVLKDQKPKAYKEMVNYIESTYRKE